MDFPKDVKQKILGEYKDFVVTDMKYRADYILVGPYGKRVGNFPEEAYTRVWSNGVVGIYAFG